MKRKLFALLIVLMIILPLCASAAADGAFLGCTAEPLTDGAYDLAVSLSGAQDAAMLQFTLFYDPTQLSVLNAQFGNLFSGNQAPVVNVQVPGEIRMIWDSLRPLGADGVILVLRLQRVGTEDTVLSFDQDKIILSREDFSDYDVTCENCLIKGTAAEPSKTAAASQAAQTAASTAAPQAAQAAANTAAPQAAQAASSTAAPQAAQAASSTAAPQAVQAASSTAAPQAVQAASSTTEPQPASTPTNPSQQASAMDSVLIEGTSEGLTMVESKVTVSAGQTKEMEVLEKDANLTWSSSNEQIATVDDSGVVTTHRAGTALITASSLDGDAYASSVITVEGDAEPLAATPSPAVAATPSPAVAATPAPQASAAATPAESQTPAPKKTEFTPIPSFDSSPGKASEEETAPIPAETGRGPVTAVVIAVAAACLAIYLIRKKTH